MKEDTRVQTPKSNYGELRDDQTLRQMAAAPLPSSSHAHWSSPSLQGYGAPPASLRAAPQQPMTPAGVIRNPSKEAVGMKSSTSVSTLTSSTSTTGASRTPPVIVTKPTAAPASAPDSSAAPPPPPPSRSAAVHKPGERDRHCWPSVMRVSRQCTTGACEVECTTTSYTCR
jgi:hypothetical protein